MEVIAEEAGMDFSEVGEGAAAVKEMEDSALHLPETAPAHERERVWD